jgi:nucleotide-binding universal stress UspA family protein
METQKSNVLVTWDFTEKSDIAFQHALSVNNTIPCNIKLVHIIKKAQEQAAAEMRLKDEIKRLNAKFGYDAEYIVREGTIFTTITDIVNSEAASMVFMGTHGMKGMQKLLGSWALKVIAKSRSPFIVVQDPPKKEKFEKIVVPVNFKSENKESARWIDFLHKHFDADFLLLRANNTDARFRKGVNANLLFAQKYLRAKDIKYTVATAPGKTDFAKESVQFAKESNADMILVMTTRGLGFADYVLGAHEQYIISNEYNIPVMVINPKPVRMTGGFSATGG